MPITGSSLSRALPVVAAALLCGAWVAEPARPSAGATTLSAEVEGQRIAIRFYRPAGDGPFPLVVLSHGSPRDGAARGRMTADAMSRQAEALAAGGVAVAMPLRRGYGGQGGWAESYGTCDDPDYATAGLAGAADIREAAAVAKRQPGVDGSRVVLIGHSAGGFGSIAAGSQGGVSGVVAFAPGRGSSGPDQVCEKDELVAAMAGYGRTSRVPQLWIYSRNDRFFGPDLARRLHGAFVSAGGQAELAMVPGYRGDGHAYVEDVAAWWPRVETYLRRIGFRR